MYMTMEEFVEAADYDITSGLKVDSKTAHLSGYLKNKDFLDLTSDPFLLDDGETRALELRVVAMVKESTVAGPETDKDLLP
jgi:hypothetical protein